MMALLFIAIPFLFAEECANIPINFEKQRNTKVYYQAALEYANYKMRNVSRIIEGIISLQDYNTKLAASHYGHPGYATLTFIYDKALDALILKSAGKQKEAEQILDYFVSRLNIPIGEVIANRDTNGVYGIVKTFKSIKVLVNAVDISSTTRQGKGELKFCTTPCPASFMIYSLLWVNCEKYKDAAINLGEALLLMQDSSGGIRDGDRSPDKVHTEPHIGVYAAF